jgi:hypothetical protein
MQASDEITALAGDYMAFKSSADFGITSAASSVNITGAAGVEINSPSNISLISDGANVLINAGSNFDAYAANRISIESIAISDTSIDRYCSATDLHLTSTNTYITGTRLDILSTTLNIEGADIGILGTSSITTSSTGAITIKSGATFEVGSTNLSVDSSSMQTTCSIATTKGMTALSVTAPNGEFNTLNSDGSGTNGSPAAPEPSYSVYDPGDASPAFPATTGDAPYRTSKTDAPDPTIPEIADMAPRVPEHEPWFHHENLNPAKYSNIRAGQQSTETYIPPTPDPFTAFAASYIPATNQRLFPNTNAGQFDDEPEEPRVSGSNINTYTESAKIVIEFFLANGYQIWHAIGITGALQTESSTDILPGSYIAPTAVRKLDGVVVGGGGIGARGICQWRDNGNRLTDVEKYLGKTILVQPQMDINVIGYNRLVAERLPTTDYAGLPNAPGQYSGKYATANATLEEQLGALLNELNTSESFSKRAILAVNSGSDLDSALEVAKIMNYIFLRSEKKSESNTITNRLIATEELYYAYTSGRSTDPVTDPDQFPSIPLADNGAGTDPAANSRLRSKIDPFDLSTASNAGNVVNGTANTRASNIRTNLRSALNRAARDSGIANIDGFSFAGESLRRINTSYELPVDIWGTFPSRADGPDADMKYDGGWKKYNPSTGTYTFRPNGAEWRTGTERHDTGLAIDCRLQVRDNSNSGLRTLLPSNPADQNRIVSFLRAFARYGGRGVGIGSDSARFMKDGSFHLDMLGALIQGRPVSVTGFDNPANVIGWNRQPVVWRYGNASTAWALAAITNTGGMV